MLPSCWAWELPGVGSGVRRRADLTLQIRKEYQPVGSRVPPILLMETTFRDYSQSGSRRPRGEVLLQGTVPFFTMLNQLASFPTSPAEPSKPVGGLDDEWVVRLRQGCRRALFLGLLPREGSW